MMRPSDEPERQTPFPGPNARQQPQPVSPCVHFTKPDNLLFKLLYFTNMNLVLV